MTLRPARKLAVTAAASAALLTGLLTWQAAAADTGSDGSGRESRPGAAVSDTATGKESRATPGKGSDTVSSKEVEHSGTSAADYWTPERMRKVQPAPMPVVER
ncbi:hypothetical protein [Streptomyces flavofungini]|uniref:Uncharacterized protein n=1 Tax=Streptomyces flavofungini TaxID=68200 RepID=A0ABS0X613_9ACTN|nr:hypothetical protein [Streptomyces flavofungini]MBJ3808646.1 hypothetical protein [Streptomyces flavofungini]GHC70696.1 hypothetical protein GCM10010349_46650 [Streptomyces flavofungini]